MQKYVDWVFDTSGNALSGATVTVKNASDKSTATIYSDDGVTGASNPLTSAADGVYSFFAANGLYDVVISKSGYSFETTERQSLTLYDPLDGLATGTGTLGSVYFAGTGGAITQDNANFFWDNTNKRLGIGTASPGSGFILDVSGASRTWQRIVSTAAGSLVSFRLANTANALYWDINLQTNGDLTFNPSSGALNYSIACNQVSITGTIPGFSAGDKY